MDNIARSHLQRGQNIGIIILEIFSWLSFSFLFLDYCYLSCHIGREHVPPGKRNSRQQSPKLEKAAGRGGILAALPLVDKRLNDHCHHHTSSLLTEPSFLPYITYSGIFEKFLTLLKHLPQHKLKMYSIFYSNLIMSTNLNQLSPDPVPPYLQGTLKELTLLSLGGLNVLLWTLPHSVYNLF